MPRGDRTGPEGMGPVTGRGLGFCTGPNNVGFMNQMPGTFTGRGYGRGAGFGFRRGRDFYRYSFANHIQSAGIYSKEEELNRLKNHSEYLKSNLDDIKKRIDMLEQDSQNND